MWSETIEQGRVNFNTNHFLKLHYFRTFKSSHSKSDILYFLRRCVSANLSLSMIQTTPSQLVLKFCWESKRPAKSNFALGERKKVCWDDNWQIGQVADCLDAFIAIWTAGLWRRCRPGIVPVLNPVLGQKSISFLLENCQRLSQRLLDVPRANSSAARLTKQRRRKVPRCQRSFLSFWSFFVFNRFDGMICLCDWC